MAIVNLRIFISSLRFPTQQCAFIRYVLPRKNKVSNFFGSIPIRYKSTQVVAVTEGEKRIAEIIKSNLNASTVEVEDISGGCGSMYRIFVASPDFQGKRTIQQHRIITSILENEVKDMHGLTIQTTV